MDNDVIPVSDQYSNIQIPYDQITRYDQLIFEKNSPRYRSYTYVKNGIMIGVLFLLAVGLYFFADEGDGYITALPYILIAISIVGVLFQMYSNTYANNLGFALREQDISARSGVIIEETISVPFKKIQHVEVSQGFIERWFKIKTLTAFTAGSTDDLVIPGLDSKEADNLKEYVSEMIKTTNKA